MPAFGYTTEEGFDVSPFIDMINGGGAGRSGDVFEGGGILSALANAIATPYGSQRERRGMPPMIYDRNDPLAGVSTSAFEDLYPRSDEELQFIGGESDPLARDPEAGAPDRTFYTRLVPLGEDEASILRSLPTSLIPEDLRDAIEGDEVPYSAVLELRDALGTVLGGQGRYQGEYIQPPEIPRAGGPYAGPVAQPSAAPQPGPARQTMAAPPNATGPIYTGIDQDRIDQQQQAYAEAQARLEAQAEPRPVPTLTPLEPGPSALSPAAQIMFEGTSGAYGDMVSDDMDYEYVMSEMRRAYPGMDDAYLEQMARNLGLLPNERGVTVPFAPGFR